MPVEEWDGIPEMEQERWHDFKDTTLIGMDSITMVDQIFKKYHLLELRVIHYRDNIFDQIFPMRLAATWTGQGPAKFNQKVLSNQLNEKEQSTYALAQETGRIIKPQIFKSGVVTRLGNIHQSLNGLADKHSEIGIEKQDFKRGLYSQVLYLMAPPSMNIEFNYDTLYSDPSFWDFFHFSTIVGTSNVPSDITAISGTARFVVWAQLIWSYLLLGVLIAGIASIIFAQKGA
jgi:hypothetical protein